MIPKDLFLVYINNSNSPSRGEYNPSLTMNKLLPNLNIISSSLSRTHISLFRRSSTIIFYPRIQPLTLRFTSTTPLFSMSDAAATTQQSSYCPKVGCVCWTEIPVQDMDRAEKFYGNIFGWKFNHPAFHKEGEPVFYRVYSKEDIPMFGGGLRLTTKENHVVASEVPRTTVANRICFAVNGIEESLKLIEQEGGKRADPCMAIGEKMGYTAAFQDTEGNINSIWAASE